MEAYLDNSATTQVSESVVEIIERTMREDYGNPSSRHQKGVDAEKYLRRAKEQIAETLRVTPGEIYFTSGGTESDNWALFSAASFELFSAFSVAAATASTVDVSVSDGSVSEVVFAAAAASPSAWRIISVLICVALV